MSDIIRKTGSNISQVVKKAFISDFCSVIMFHLDKSLRYRFIFVLLNNKKIIIVHVEFEICTE